jgi:hypothetical protein
LALFAHLVDAADEQQAGPPAYTAQHQEERKAHHSIVAKEEAGLQQTMHLTPVQHNTQRQQQHTTTEHQPRALL